MSERDIVRKGKFWKDNRWAKVYMYRCELCKKRRETKNRDKALKNDNVCDTCRRTVEVSKDQQTLF